MKHFLWLTIIFLLALPLEAQEIPYDIALQRIEEARVSRATTLSLWKLGLTELPPEIWQLSNLSWLHLCENQLTSLPSEIGQLNNLQQLYLCSNQLTSLPSEIGQLNNLQLLWLDNNQLTSLPSEIGQLNNLQELGLYNNQLSSLPAEIGQLSNLCLLDISHNSLSNLPNDLSNLSHLTQTESCLGNTASLILYDNPLITPPEEVLKGETIEILAYLRNPLGWYLERYFVRGVSFISAIALLILGLRTWNRRAYKKKKKHEA